MTATHLCLVSDQPVPSLTPLLDPALAVRQVILVHAPERARHAAWLADALQRHGRAVELFALQDGYDLPGLRREMSALAGRHPQGVIANITGGSKMMTIAAWETFTRPTDRLYYVDIRRDSLRWLRPEAPEQAVADRVRLETYIVAHGQRIQPEQPLRRDPPDPANLIEWRRLARSLAADSQPHSSSGGHWLEELVFAEIEALRAEDRTLQDVARQFKVVDGDRKRKPVENEYDVAVLRDNSLYLIECKTGQAGAGKAATAALYRLATLFEGLGGLRGGGILVSSEALSARIKARAELLKIVVIDRSGLAQLKHSLAAAMVRLRG